MKRKKLWVGLAIAFQISAVAFMAISREWILANGEPLLLQTAPVDPRDIFRGDYVSLDYLFSNIPVRQLDEEILESGLRKGQKVYLLLGRDVNGVTQGERLYANPPGGTYLTGRSTQDWPYRYYQPPEKRREENLLPVSVKYGIEQYYVEQGSGLEMEEMRGSRDTFQLPMLIHARVSHSGEAVIQSYEWGVLATRTEAVQSPERDAPDERASAVMRFTMKNSSDKPITLPLKRRNCSFILIPALQTPENATDFVREREDCASAELQSITLAPGETHAVIFDLNRPHWFVNYNDKPTPTGKLAWNYRYRIQYQGDAIPGVKGRIVSRAFHGRGSID